MAEAMRPAEFRALLDRFYRAASQAIVDADGIVDNLLGDGVLALFIPAWAGPFHGQRALDAARGIVEATGNAEPNPWISVGVGIHTGVAFVGVVGQSGAADEATDFTALGDPLNTAARLSSAAAAGEILVSRVSAERIGLDASSWPRRTLDLKGKREPIDALVL
jgi:adenylate cyclase